MGRKTRFSLAAAALAGAGVVIGCGLAMRPDRQITELKGCLRNLWKYDAAKQEWAIDHDKTSADVCSGQEIMLYLKGGNWEEQVCPTAGSNTYTLGKVGDFTRCAVHGTANAPHLADGTPVDKKIF